MRVVVLWRDNTDYAREVISWLEEFRRRTGKELESLSPDELEGLALAETYDIMQYPTILAMTSDGGLHETWSGTPLPMIDEVAYYACQN